MRKNKKLLLGGLSVLTLVAAGSGAVSTFAWFKASTSQNQTLSNNLSFTAQASYGDQLNLVLEWGDGSTPINLTGVYETDASGNPYVFAKDGSLVPVAGSPKIVETATLNLKFTIGSESPVAASADTLKPYAGAYKFKVTSSTTTTKVGGSATPDGTSRMKVANVNNQAPTSTLHDMGFTVTINSSGQIASVAPTATNAALGNWTVESVNKITASTTVYMAIHGGTSSDVVGDDNVNVDTAVTGSFGVEAVA